MCFTKSNFLHIISGFSPVLPPINKVKGKPKKTIKFWVYLTKTEIILGTFSQSYNIKCQSYPENKGKNNQLKTKIQLYNILNKLGLSCAKLRV